MRNAHDRRPLLARLRRKPRWLRAIAILVTAAFLNLYLQPLAIAANLPSRPEPKAPTNEEKLSKKLQTIEDRLEKLDAKLEKREDAAKEKSELKTLRQELDTLDTQAIKDFEAIEKHLKDKKLPPVILERHYQAVQTYKQEMATLKANLNDVEASPDDGERKLKTKRAKEHLKAKSSKRRPKTQFDPNDLPNKSLQPNPKNKPKLKREQFIRAGLTDNPSVQLAAHGSFRIDQLPSAADPAYLAETAEVVLTEAIRAKAAELDHDPVKIYQWVRNNVHWLPTWGANQDADITLGSQRGNAFDIASLLIALFRASDIPVRYVHGVIEVPEDKFRNWVGGFTDINAAANYASSGGIPATGIVNGGRITRVQLEHIWVEAAIDVHPSRGGVNKSADAWVQLDASYKQYDDLPGLDVLAISGLDPVAVTQSFASSGTVNEQEGWLQGLNADILQNAHVQARTALEQHVDSLPNPMLGDVFGGRRIISMEGSVLPTNLSNRVLVIGARYSTVPSQLQHRMTFAFGLDLIREPVNPVTFPWSKLNNHKVTLSFRPASKADEDALNSFIPSGPVTALSQLPSSVPSYLVFVIPQVALDGRVVGQGNAMRLGEELEFFYEIFRVGQGSHTYTYEVPAGSYLSVAVAGGSVSHAAVEKVDEKLQQTRATLASRNVASIEQLTQEDIVGDMYHAGVLSYFGQYIALSNIMNASQRALQSLPFAYGTLGYEPSVQTLFGFPRAIRAGGIIVNVRLGWTIQTRNGDMSRWRDLNLQSGSLSSALEHSIPEQMFSTLADPVQGVSAVKALQMAAQQGQRIYHLTPANRAETLPNLRLDALALSEISAALSAGREVIAHTDRISLPGWQGEGYILFDPITGEGAYKITGGSNGGDTQLLVDFFTFIAAAALGFIDGKTGKYAGNVYIFSDQLKYLAKIAKVSAVLGLVAFILDLATIWTSDDLDLSSKLGRTGMAALGFAITAVVTAGLAFWLAPLVAALLAMLVALVIAIAISVVNTIYFSLLDRRRDRAFA